MVRQRSLVSAAWEYFKGVEGGARCQIEGCTHPFLKRASGSSTKFLWSHLDAHHRELSKELGRLGKKRVRKINKKIDCCKHIKFRNDRYPLLSIWFVTDRTEFCLCPEQYSVQLEYDEHESNGLNQWPGELECQQHELDNQRIPTYR